MRITIFVFLLLIKQNLSPAQADTLQTAPKRNTIYIEAFGQAILNSLSFDRLYRIDKRVKTSFTLGIMLAPDGRMGIPVSYNWIFGKKKNPLELGAGLTYWRETGYHNNSADNYLYLTPKISYRLQNPKGGFFFRFSFTPSIGLIEYSKWDGAWWRSYFENPLGDFIFPWGGISIGYTLKR